MKKAILILLLLSFPVVASSQLKSQASGIDMRKVLRYGINPVGIFTKSLLDPEKFHMSQSYILSVGNFGGQAFNQAIYLNTMRYQISQPLSVMLQWGYLMNQPLGGSKGTQFGMPNLPFKNGFFISNAQLNYKPTKNMEFNLEFRQWPMNPYSYSGWYVNPFWRN